MRSKFKVGDLVFLNGRTPEGVIDPRHTHRTVVGVLYDRRLQASLYTLGDNHLELRGLYCFRSYMLHPISEMPRVGHPRIKRQYHFHRHYTQNKSNTISLDNSVVATVLQDREVVIGGEREVLYTLVEKNGVFKRERIK